MGKTCGAKTRSGEPCKNLGMANGRCRMHGGKAKPGHSYAPTPGSIYSKFFTEEERALESQIEIGKLDDEIRLCRIRLRRVLAEEQRAYEVLDEMPDEESGDRPEPKNYDAIADRLIGRIQQLEKTRKELMGDNGDEDDLVDPNPDV